MIGHIKAAVAIIAIILFAHTVAAADFTVGKAVLSSTAWGAQKAQISLVNQSDDYKIVKFKAEIKYSGSAIETFRGVIKSFIVEPIITSNLELPFEIPGNFGTVNIRISLYDVVDTLDPLLDSQRFFTRDFTHTYPVPEVLKSLVSSTMPMAVFMGQTELFDNFLTRIIIALLYEGRNPDEIARAAGADPGYVSTLVNRLAAAKYLKKNGSSFIPTLAVIDSAAMLKIVPIIDRTVENMYKTIVANIPRYDSTVAAMAASGRLTRDRNDAFDGGSVLYHKHPAVLGLLLWDELGVDFINDGIPFNILERSDPCDAHLGNYAYMVTGTSDRTGHSFYYNSNDAEIGRFQCALTDIPVACQLRYKGKGDMRDIYDWSFSDMFPPILYSYNPGITTGVLSLLIEEKDRSIAELKTELTRQFALSPNGANMKAIRLWCWNVVVTDLMKKLELNKIITKEGNGFYIYQRTIS
jgi:hypothetical protein